jgi:hypothetical protein
MCSILCWILSIWQALGCIFCIFGLIHALSTRGRSLSLFWLLDASRRFSSGFEPFSGSVAHRSDRSECWSCAHVEHRSDRSELSWCNCSVFHQVVCMHSFRGSCIGSGGACMCAGGALCGFRALVGGLRSLLEHSFVSDVSSRCPCLRGSRLFFFKWSFFLPLFGFRSLLGVYFYSFLLFYYSLGLLYVCVVNALIKGEIEDHVWFEDRLMFAS